MNSTIKRLYLIAGAFLLNFILVLFTWFYAEDHWWIFITCLVVVVLPLYVLVSKDALILRADSPDIPRSQATRIWLVACLPVIFFGLLGIVFGLSMIGWVLYNLFVEKQEEFSKPALSGALGVGPSMFFCGIFLLRMLWKKRRV